MPSGSLTDLDPPAPPERRWPFYVAWAMGGLVIGAVLLGHSPSPATHRGSVPVAEPAATGAPAEPITAPAAPRVLIPLPLGTPFRAAPVRAAPAHP
ncbi:MAG TPA: hypothetical protein VGT60_09850 [Candidatus Limnocylindria bacterium]|nr:hypothetical protein [Candidatus Limnocylindria bacterium]